MKTVVIPAAGQGTRLLPLTKCTPKEMLPVFDKPILQFALDEACGAGAERIVVVTHQSKPAIANYVSRDDEAIESLRQLNKPDLASVLMEAGAPQHVEISVVEQSAPLGLGHAILMAQPHCVAGPIGVILPDDVILGEPALPEMALAYEGGHLVAAMEVDRSSVGRYGIFNVKDHTPKMFKAKSMVEKPLSTDAPSSIAAVGRYILDPSIFLALSSITRGAGEEYQLTDAIASDLLDRQLYGFKFSGTRFDCGTHKGLLDAGTRRRAEVLEPVPFQTAAE
ncbi:UTP--glucose-1-phosphate uridylyltransferase [Sulfitobacter sp. S190]|uniref:UTP--glucose-1-phosphate uridylyltransferase n=1 Tax=Sulfitobacter sp. S190 TaxID=2867022 RepID=UPI0021A7EB9A|nr:sugar phosphate nucleotidyltransferase [Sulfitobacter sp. S190]UWR21262.1 NTP transferase domain-containing protein [Sulfitobacter sp. S190]